MENGAFLRQILVENDIFGFIFYKFVYRSEAIEIMMNGVNNESDVGQKKKQRAPFTTGPNPFNLHLYISSSIHRDS